MVITVLHDIKIIDSGKRKEWTGKYEMLGKSYVLEDFRSPRVKG